MWTAWVVRGHTNQKYEQMSHGQITERLKVLGDDKNHLRDSPEQRKEWLMRFERTRHLIVWGGGGFNNIKPWLPPIYHSVCVWSSLFLKRCRNEGQGIWCHWFSCTSWEAQHIHPWEVHWKRSRAVGLQSDKMPMFGWAAKQPADK